MTFDGQNLGMSEHFESLPVYSFRFHQEGTRLDLEDARRGHIIKIKEAVLTFCGLQP